MSNNGKTVEFKEGSVKFVVSNLESPGKRICKIQAKQKVNNILVLSEVFEKYVINNDEPTLKVFTLWIDVKVFGKQTGKPLKPAYNYQINANLESKYNAVYDVTNEMNSIRKGSKGYDKLQQFTSFIANNFDEYIVNAVNLAVEMNNGNEFIDVPDFILDVHNLAEKYEETSINQGK